MKLCPICATSYPDANRTCPTHGTLLVDSEELPAGTMIRDCYRIERVIGKGGMGTVYLAEHVLLGEQRALKFLSTALAANPQFLQRFLQEARAASKLRHPNIAATLELGQSESGSLYICMEYVDGPSLRSVLKSSPQGLAPERAFAIARGVAQGLGAAHAKGMVHRDVKPENILLGTVEDAGTRAEIAKVVDFGIVAMSDSNSHLTQTGQQLLTAEYAAPEQWRGASAASLDGRTDFYSLGCVLFEMLTGRQPFQSNTFEGWYQHHLYDAPPTASSLRPELARIRGLDALLAQFLAKDREHRPHDASTLVAMIDVVTAAMNGGQEPSAEIHTATGRPSTAATSWTGPTIPSSSTNAPEWIPVPSATTPLPLTAPPDSHIPTAPQANQAQPAIPPSTPFHDRSSSQSGLPLHPQPLARKQSGIRTGVLFAILGGFLVLTIGVVGAFLYLRKNQEPQPTQADTSSASTPASPADATPSSSSPSTPVSDLPANSDAATPSPAHAAEPGTSAHTAPPANPHTATSTAAPPNAAELAARAIALFNQRNYAEAAALLSQACTSGSAAACSHLGASFQNGVGVSQDAQRARTLYAKACDGGFAEGCLALAKMYQSKVEGGQDLTRAATYYGKACSAGNMAGCNSLGSFYQRGQGTEVDLAKALALYQKACDHTFADGCNNLGFMYQQNVGVERDYTKAASFYEKACNSGNAFACNNLGIMYQDSEGLPQDYAKAASLYTKACTGGSSNGCSDLGELYRRGLGVAKDTEKARAYLSKGCAMGNQWGCQHMKLIP